MDSESSVDRRLVRRSFERAAATYDAAAVLQNEVCERMLERLDYIKLTPARLLDAGTGTGNALSGLTRRFPGVPIVALDVALGMLLKARERTSIWERLVRRARRPVAVCADMERLPLAAGSVGLVWSNLALQWLNEPAAAFGEFHRALAAGGLVMFSTFGPDTLHELKAAYAADGYTHVNRFIDMHDLGDRLLNAGFADPVVDMERITLTYADVRDLMRDLKAIGAHNVTAGRPRALSPRSRLAAVIRHYETFRTAGRLPATFEVVYGHAWKPAPRLGPGGRRVIDIKPSAGA